MTQTGKVYGDALYELALEEQRTETVGAQLRTLAESFRAEPRFLTLLSTPSISKEERCRVIDDSFGGKLDPYVLNFLKLLTERGVISRFEQCSRQFLLRYNEDNGIVPVRVVTAVELSEELRERLEQKLVQITGGRRPDVTYAVDPACLGGMRLDYDGTRLDGTVLRRLENMKQVLKNTVL